MNENKGKSNCTNNNDICIEEYSIARDTTSDSSQSSIDQNDTGTKIVDSAGNDKGSLERNDKGHLDRIMNAVMRIEESQEKLREQFCNLQSLVGKIQNGQQTTPFASFVTVAGRNSVSTVTN